MSSLMNPTGFPKPTLIAVNGIITTSTTVTIT